MELIEWRWTNKQKMGRHTKNPIAINCFTRIIVEQKVCGRCKFCPHTLRWNHNNMVGLKFLFLIVYESNSAFEYVDCITERQVFFCQ